MTARLATTLGAIALGLAAFAAAPVLAQGSAGSGGQAGGQGGNVPSQAGSMPNPGAGNTAPMGTGTMGGSPNAGGAGSVGTMGQGANTGHMGATGGTASGRTASGMQAGGSTAGHGPTHHAARRPTHHAARHASAGDTAAGEAAIARLNEQSLQAAQQGRGFSPGGAQQQ